MPRRLWRGAALAAVTLYFGLGWALMRSDYFVAAGRSSETRQFIHLGTTFFLLLLVILWKGNVLERFIERLSALPWWEGIAPFIACVPVLFSMLRYPQGSAASSGAGWALMESTRSLIQQVFLAGAVAGGSLFLIRHARRPAQALFDGVETILFASPRKMFIGTTALLMFAGINALSYFHFHHLPVLSEEVAYLFQGRIFSSGRFAAAIPALPEFFTYDSIVMTDRWFVTAAPGFPLLLALGFLAHSPWIINPIFAAGSLVLVFGCAEKMYGERIARGAAALMLLSPFTLLLSSLVLSYVSAVFFILLFMFLVLKGIQEGSKTAFLFSGLAFGGSILIAPVIGVALGLPWIIYLLALSARRHVRPLSVAALLGGAAVSVVMLFGYYEINRWGAIALHDHFALGSGYESGLFTLPSSAYGGNMVKYLLQGIVNLNHRLHYFGMYLQGWPIPVFLLAAVPFAAASKNKWDYLLLGQIFLVLLAFFSFYHREFLFGPRYYLVIVPAALILTARGFQVAPALWRRLTGGTSEGSVPLFLCAVLACSIAFNVAYFLPSRLSLYTPSSYIFKQLPSPIQRHIESERVQNAVVFIDGFPFYCAYGAGVWRNDPMLVGDIIYARDLRNGNVRLMEQYPGRTYYRYAALTDSFQKISPESYLQNGFNFFQ